eukprot:c15522_g1_i1 orf=472-1827(-)
MALIWSTIGMLRRRWNCIGRCRLEWSMNTAKLSSSAAAEVETVLFPREGPGISYALNWSLAVKGVPPQGEAFRNLKNIDLKKHGAITSDQIAGQMSGCSVYAHGSFSAGATEITKAQFNKILKEVSLHLSSVPKIFVHDGAVGSSPRFDVKVRSICDHPSVALAIQDIVCPVPNRVVSHELFPLTVYAASGFRSSMLEQLGCISTADTGYVIIDYDQSAMVLGGNSFADSSTVKVALAALAAPKIMSRSGLPLAARILVQGDSVILILSPENVVKSYPALLEASVTKDAGCAWSADGLATLFKSVDCRAPNLFKSPSSVVLITMDSTGAIPSISKLNPGQAAYHFLAGYHGESFVPAYQSGLASVHPLLLSKEFLSLLTNKNVPAFLVNASDGEKIVAEKELMKMIEASSSQKFPRSKGKKPSEATVELLKDKYTSFTSRHFPDLPEGVSM